MELRLKFLSAFGGPHFAAAFFAGLLVVFAGLEDFQDPLALHFFLEALQGLLQAFVFTHLDFQHSVVFLSRISARPAKLCADVADRRIIRAFAGRSRKEEGQRIDSN